MRRRTTLAALSGALAAATAGVVVTAPPAGGATTETVTFGFTGGPQTFTVPVGVTELAVDAYGAQGGTSGSSADEGRWNSTGSRGGYGARARATMAVTPGETLEVHVGGYGGNGTASTAGGVPTATAAPGGFNGGGGGDAATAVVGSGTSMRTAAAASGGGGGGSDVRRGGFGLGDRVLVAGGGGGGGSLGFRDGPNGVAFALSPVGGNGGGLTGQGGGDGTATNISVGPGGKGGGGGTQTEGGAGGNQGGTAGTSGSGGTGTASAFASPPPGEFAYAAAGASGGGAGGYFGGGGGGVLNQEVSAGASGGGGGGGSGFGPPGTVFNTNARAGSGVATFTFEVTVVATVLTYDGAISADYHDPATLSATLREEGAAGAPVPGATVTFTLGDQSCVGVTDAAGRASCAVVPDVVPGEYTVEAVYAGDAAHLGATGSSPFTVTKEQTSAAYVGPDSVRHARSATLTGELTEDDGAPVADRTIVITLGSGGRAQSCTATTAADGTGSCTIAKVHQHKGRAPVTVSFAGDDFYEPSEGSGSVSVVSPGGE